MLTFVNVFDAFVFDCSSTTSKSVSENSKFQLSINSDFIVRFKMAANNYFTLNKSPIYTLFNSMPFLSVSRPFSRYFGPKSLFCYRKSSFLWTDLLTRKREVHQFDLTKFMYFDLFIPESNEWTTQNYLFLLAFSSVNLIAKWN